MTQIKVCGLFRNEDIKYVNEAKPEYAGFVIDFPKSHRSVTPKRAADLKNMLNNEIKSVGVFVNQPINRLAEMAVQTGIDMIQLHGMEDENYIQSLQEKIHIPVIKAFQIHSKEDLKKAEQSSADYILLDSGQGTGKCFDWSMLGKMKRPYFLAGGLTPEIIPKAIRMLHPMIIDISSGVETEKKKDIKKIRKAVEIAHKGE